MCSICITTLLGSMKCTKKLDYLDEIVDAFKSQGTSQKNEACKHPKCDEVKN